MYNIFNVSLLDNEITKKRQIKKKVKNLESNLYSSNDKKYKMINIKDSPIYVKKTQK